MAKADKNRVPGETLTYAPASGQLPSSSWPCVMSVCLWADPSKRLDCRYSKNNSPLLALALDVIRSSGGIQGSEEQELLSASFPDIKSGMLSARRIQWAIDGLAEFEPFKTAVAAILVDYPDTTARPAGSLSREWSMGLDRQRPNAGQIFLSQRVCETVEGLPSVALENPIASGLRSWAWKTGQGLASFAADEQSVLGMIRAAGRTDPVVVSPQLPPAPLPGPATSTLRHAPDPAGERMATARFEVPEPPARKSPLIPIVIGSVAVVAVAVAVALVFNHKQPSQVPLPPQSLAPAQNSGPSAAPATPAAHAKQPDAHRKPPSLIDKLVNKQPAAEEPKAPPPPVESRCDLTDEDIQRSLSRADRYMHDGDLSDAKAAYLHVLGCPSSRAKAQEGLTRIQRMAAESGSPQP